MPNTVMLVRAEAMQFLHGGSLIEHARDTVQWVMKLQGISITPAEKERIAKNVCRKREAQKGQMTVMGTNWLTHNLGFPAPEPPPN